MILAGVIVGLYSDLPFYEKTTTAKIIKRLSNDSKMLETYVRAK